MSLKLEGVTKRYGELLAVDRLDLAIPAGQMFGFVGTNGAGKTTTMRIIMGVLEHDAGTVHWEGRPVDADARRGFGYMPEERGLYPKMRIRDQLVYLAEMRGAKATAAERATDELLAEFGLADRKSDRVEQLSLGNQQRVQLAAALVHDPTFLVLDEPFSGLDPVGVDALAHLLDQRVRRGVGVLFSSHQLDLVERLCDAVGIIRAGRIVASGTVEELRTKNRPRQYRVVVAEGLGEQARALPGNAGTTGSASEEPNPTVSTGPRAWADGVPGVRVLDQLGQNGNGTVTLAELLPDADEQRLLDAARAAGRVTEFRPIEPTLAELFRETVSEETEPLGTEPLGTEHVGAAG